MTTSGYKTNKTGFKIGTGFEYYDDFNLGLATSHYYEKFLQIHSIHKTTRAKGNYWDSFINLSFTQDKRNQKFQASRGHISRYELIYQL